MLDTRDEESVNKEQIDTLKKTHDYYITMAQILSQRVQFYAEEFDGVKELISFCKIIAETVKKSIDALEPKDEKIEETKT